MFQISDVDTRFERSRGLHRKKSPVFSLHATTTSSSAKAPLTGTICFGSVVTSPRRFSGALELAIPKVVRSGFVLCIQSLSDLFYSDFPDLSWSELIGRVLFEVYQIHPIQSFSHLSPADFRRSTSWSFPWKHPFSPVRNSSWKTDPIARLVNRSARKWLSRREYRRASALPSARVVIVYKPTVELQHFWPVLTESPFREQRFRSAGCTSSHIFKQVW